MKARMRVLAIVLFITGIVISAFVLTVRRTGEPGRKASANGNSSSKSNKDAVPNAGHSVRENGRDLRGVEANVSLLNEFRAAAFADDGEEFRLALSAMLSRKFAGDPAKVLEELTSYLDHENEKIRFELAKMYVWAGSQDEKVVQTLLFFVENEENKPTQKEFPGQPGEIYTEDFRKSAAKLLTAFRIQEAVDSLWTAYEQTSDRLYLRHLSVFRDGRVSEEALNLIEAKKAKYSDLHKVFGIYKVAEAAKPLEKIFNARQERDPGRNQSELAWSLYQITGSREYYDYLVEREFYVHNTLFDVPDVLGILENDLRKDDGSDPNAKGDRAFLSLLARDGGREIVENYLVEVFEEKITSPVDVATRYQVAAHLNVKALNGAAQFYEDKYENGFWPHYSKRKGWPIYNLLVGYDY